jgi:drug/metabolite transporter (DMT)-like permease
VWLGLLLALGTSVTWALGNVLIQRSGRAVGAPRAMMWALGAGAVLSGLCALAFDARREPVSASTLGWLGIGAVSGVVAYVTLFYALGRARLSIAIPFIASWSLWSALFSFLVFGERPRALQLAGAACVLAGVILVSLDAAREAAPAADRSANGRALLASLVSGLAFGVMVPSLPEAAGAAGDFGATALVYALGLLLAWPIARVARLELSLPSRAVWPLLLLTGLCETAGFVFVTLARRFAPMAVVAPVASLSSALTILFGWIALGEPVRPVAAAGAALACAGLVILTL